ncbi:hypothetical protein [Pantoea ananatis]|uniref:phage tail fiber protein n=1 Tax=Pantoea ananas TaxID=553 RepID=UPI001FF0B426|nr:hypothetical protein [Pantoea ananatis]
MPAGTIALTNKSATVAGTGTSFTTELKAGDFVYVNVGGAPYTLVAANITSDTQLTLAVAFDGPTTSGLAWNAVPASLQVAITQKILNDFASVARGRILDFQNWQKIYSDAQSVDVIRPDRTTFTGPSWGYMSTQFGNMLTKTDNLASLSDKAASRTNLGWVSGALPVALGGSGGTTQATARAGLGLGTASTADKQTSATDKTSGSLVMVGGFGLGASLTAPVDYSGLVNVAPGLYQLNGSNWNSASGNYGGMVSFGDSSNGAQLFIQNNGGNFMYRGQSNKSVYIVRSTQNTTVDGSGYIKQASPIARLSNDQSIMAANFYDGFTDAGNASVNEEAEGVRARRSGLGAYIVTGCTGLASEGWQIEVPKDINGNRLCFVKSEVTDAGNLSIKVFKPKLDLDTGGIIAGDAMDIPEGRWIDLRLDMPDNSAYNLSMKRSEAESAGQNADSDS